VSILSLKEVMHRQHPVIQLSNHVKTRLERHHRSQPRRPLSNASDDIYDTSSIDDSNDRLGSFQWASADDEQQQPAESFLSKKQAMPNESLSYLEEKYAKQKPCRDCSRRAYLLQVEQQRLDRVSHDNQKLHSQIRSSIALNRHYADENRRLKSHLDKINTHLYQYQQNFDRLKQKIVSHPKSEEEQIHVDHLQRLRHEVEIYNRHVAGKDRLLFDNE
jgi:hypothetical protein